MLLRSRAVRWAVYAVVLLGLVALSLVALLQDRTAGPGFGMPKVADDGPLFSDDPATHTTRIFRTRRPREERPPLEPDTTSVGRLVDAATAGDVATVSELLAEGVDPNTPNIHGRLPLHRAASGGSLEVVELLLAAGADANVKDRITADIGWFPLSHAAEAGSPEITARLLKEAGLPELVGSGDSFLMPVVDGALHTEENTDATNERRAEVMRLLLEAGATTASIDAVLFKAVALQSATLVAPLLEHGARLEMSSQMSCALLRLPGPLGDLLRDAHAEPTKPVSLSTPSPSSHPDFR